MNTEPAHSISKRGRVGEGRPTTCSLGWLSRSAPFSFPVGVNAGVYYRFSSSAHGLSPVVIPEVTAAPDLTVIKNAKAGEDYKIVIEPKTK
jgi:hypothetical protein